jgi:SAM-dependent methyltransferase
MSDRPRWYGYNHQQNEKVLDLGCGGTKVPGSTGVDMNPGACVDYVHNLDNFPYPFQDNSFDAIYLNHCLEHLLDPKKTLEECIRIARPDGVIFITVPHFTNPASFGDVTHRRYFSFRAILGLAGNVAFNNKTLALSKMRVTCRISPFTPAINLFPRFWEDYFGYIIPGRALYYRFQVKPAL